MKNFWLNLFRLFGGKKFACSVIDLTTESILFWFYLYGFKRHKVRARINKKFAKLKIKSLHRYFIDVKETKF